MYFIAMVLNAIIYIYNYYYVNTHPMVIIVFF
jgi:hypothetical protein